MLDATDTRDTGALRIGVPTSNHLSRRIAWGAVLAGVVVVLASQLFLDLIGLSFGAGSLSAMRQQNLLGGLGTGAVLWFGISTIVAVFAGAWVAARLAGVPRVEDGILHGLVTWGTAALVTAFLVTTTAGSLFSGVAGILGRSVMVLSRNIVNTSATMQVPGVAQMRAGQDGLTETLIQRALAQLSDPSIGMGAAPGEPSDEATALNSPAAKNIMARFFNRGSDQALSAEDKAATVNLLVVAGNLPLPTAEKIVDQWDSMYLQMRGQLDQERGAAAQEAKQVSDQTAAAIAKTAAWTAVIMALGAFAGFFGGFEAVPRALRAQSWQRRKHPLPTPMKAQT